MKKYKLVINDVNIIINKQICDIIPLYCILYVHKKYNDTDIILKIIGIVIIKSPNLSLYILVIYLIVFDNLVYIVHSNANKNSLILLKFISYSNKSISSKLI